ncbi:MAG TPA: DUF1178 family protein [Burkholderiaceae bacterium]|nr:DUF1178 family protein [Burkholderiaceae bacterium]
MLVLNLACAAGHLFEGWFASGEDCESQQRRGLLSCPVCGSLEVERRPSAPRLNVSHLRAEKAGQGASARAAAASSATPASVTPVASVAPAENPDCASLTPEALQQLQARYLQAARALARAAEDVGERFAEEARRIHHGEAEERAIRGQSTAEEVRELLDEGIPLMPLILPEGDGELH